MKLYLASFFEEENHGSGRKIGIAPGKPKGLTYDCDIMFEQLSPGDLYYDYHSLKKTDPDKAAIIFTQSFQSKLDAFFKEVSDQGLAEDVLPFEEGDTLLSWEKKGNLSYRTMVAKTLRKLGYDVQEN